MLQVSSSPPVVCRDVLFVVDVQRYSRDQGSSVYFPQAVLSGETDSRAETGVDTTECDGVLCSVPQETTCMTSR